MIKVLGEHYPVEPEGTTVTAFQVPFARYGETISLIPFGDIHRDSSACSESAWHDWLHTVSKRPNAMFLGMGDYMDMASSSERVILMDKKLHESTQKSLNKVLDKWVIELARELDFMRGNLLGLVEGNHFGVYPNGTTTTQKLCELLGCRYLGGTAAIRLSFLQKKRKTTTSLDIFAHHSGGAKGSGGRTPGASVNKIAQMRPVCRAQVYLLAHDHQKGFWTTEELEIASGMGEAKLRNVKILYGRTGSFMRGYPKGEATYVSKAALPPANLGGIEVELIPRRIQANTGETHEIDIRGREL